MIVIQIVVALSDPNWRKGEGMRVKTENRRMLAGRVGKLPCIKQLRQF